MSDDKETDKNINLKKSKYILGVHDLSMKRLPCPEILLIRDIKRIRNEPKSEEKKHEQ